MEDIKIEEIKIVISYNPKETSKAFDDLIQWVYEGEVYSEYKVLAYSNPLEYKLTKKGE